MATGSRDLSQIVAELLNVRLSSSPYTGSTKSWPPNYCCQSPTAAVASRLLSLFFFFFVKLSCNFFHSVNDITVCVMLCLMCASETNHLFEAYWLFCCADHHVYFYVYDGSCNCSRCKCSVDHMIHSCRLHYVFLQRFSHLMTFRR